MCLFYSTSLFVTLDYFSFTFACLNGTFALSCADASLHLE